MWERWDFPDKADACRIKHEVGFAVSFLIYIQGEVSILRMKKNHGR